MIAGKLMRGLVVALLVAAGFTGQAQARDLRININADPEMIDPVTFSALIAGDVLRNVYQNFTRVDETGHCGGHASCRTTTIKPSAYYTVALGSNCLRTIAKGEAAGVRVGDELVAPPSRGLSLCAGRTTVRWFALPVPSIPPRENYRSREGGQIPRR